MLQKYYNPSKLLNMKDLDGNTPEIFICTTNRTGGKTTAFTDVVVDNFLCKEKYNFKCLKKGGKFMFLYRFTSELKHLGDKIFKDVGELFYPESVMRSVNYNDEYVELFLDDKSCGYAVSINSPDKVKRNSHLFSDTCVMILDEFQSESGKYCSNEVESVISIHTSIARGQGKQSRYVPLILIGNPVTILNPYYVALGITDRIKDDTRFMRGHGFVMEYSLIESASSAQKESAFNRAFSANKYMAFNTENVYLNDSKTFIEKPSGKSNYIATIRYNRKNFAIREYPECGYLYCDMKADTTFPTRISVTTDDLLPNYIMMKKNDFLISNFRYYFQRGAFRFKDLQCKQAVTSMLSL